MRLTVNLVFLILSVNSFGQSYEEIVTLLKDKNYASAEPQLRSYLKTHRDNPSAFYYMANILENKMNVSIDGNEVLSLADSAILFYNLAYYSITKKEVEKNEKYYPSFTRRDLKTGAMGVKISDIQYDIEKRISNLTVIKKAMELPITKRLTNVPKDEKKEEPRSLNKADGRYYAIIIGVSSYDSTDLNLDRPIQDALELQKVLTKNYEFSEDDIYLLQNPTRNQIIFTLYNFRKKISTIDNLLIFYAGHGHWDSDANQGYWWPRDATPNNPSNWLSNSDIREQIRGIKSFHTLLISDACFSGGIFKARGSGAIKGAPMDIIALYKLPSRRAITSGTLTQVPDRSVFFQYLIKRLKENQTEYLTSQSLFDSFKQAVINNSQIVPQDGVITDTGDEGGDFVFIRRKK